MDEQQRRSLMHRALTLAREAERRGEVPVGCVIADAEGHVIAGGSNRTIEKKDPTAHAEVEAIREACALRGDWRLEDCTLVVTLEPCPMCTGAMMNARIPTLVYGARDGMKGACGGVLDLFSEDFPDKCAVFGNVLGEECASLLSGFFRTLR